MQLIVTAVLDAAFAVALGFAIPRWPLLVLATAAWPAYVLSRKLSLWGHGVGDGWIQAVVVLTIVTMFATGLGVLLRRRRHPSTHPATDSGPSGATAGWQNSMAEPSRSTRP